MHKMTFFLNSCPVRDWVLNKLALHWRPNFFLPTAIKTHSPDKPVLVFVSSRRQTRLTALDLIAFLAAEDNPKQWLHMGEMEVSRLEYKLVHLMHTGVIIEIKKKTQKHICKALKGFHYIFNVNF